MSDWKSCTLEDICEIYDGPHATPTKQNSGPYFLSISSLQGGQLDLSESAFLSEEDYALWTKRVTPRHMDIVFSYETRLGQAGMIPDSLRCCLGRRMGLLRIKDANIANPSFLLHYYLGEPFQRVIKDNTVFGTTVDRIPLQKMGEFPITLPPLPEQKKIAEILSGIDRSIQARQYSIHKTDRILRAMQENLMTGVEEWQEYMLGDLLSFRNGLNTEKEKFGRGVPFVSYKNVYSGGILTTKNLSQSVSLSAAEEERFLLKSGDILFTRTSETPEEIGFSCVFDDSHGGAIFNGFCIRGRPLEGEKLTPDFASFYLRSESVLGQMRFLCKYTTRAGISAESLSRVKVRIPDRKTQQRLADSLIAVKEYRATQEESVRNLNNIKKSVSSDLLSGRKRVSI